MKEKKDRFSSQHNNLRYEDDKIKTNRRMLLVCFENYHKLRSSLPKLMNNQYQIPIEEGEGRPHSAGAPSITVQWYFYLSHFQGDEIYIVYFV